MLACSSFKNNWDKGSEKGESYEVLYWSYEGGSFEGEIVDDNWLMDLAAKWM